MTTEKELNVAVVGATGAVGETMIKILEERNFPVTKLFPLASEKSVGKVVMFRGKAVRVQALPSLISPRFHLACFQRGAVFRQSMHQRQLNQDAS